jgi:cyclic beta-1,2-glucan synthetase
MAVADLRRLVPAAPAALLHLLDGSRGAVQPPIRSEIFGLQRFAQHGRSLGETHRAERRRARAATFFPRLRSNIAVLREAHRYIGVQAATGYDVSPAAEWLLDNFHLIDAQLKEVHEGLPLRYFRALPVLQDEPLAGLPRVYGVAWAFVAHTDGAFDEDLLVQFLCAYGQTRELNLNEMWALPTTLRVVLIENLRRLAERVATNKAAREMANLCCDRIEHCPVPVMRQVQALLEQRGVSRPFLAQVAQRLHDLGAAASDGPLALHGAWLREALPDLAALQSQQAADQAADNLSVSNAVSSLRAIGDVDWPDIVARTSALMRLMLGWPLFAAEHPMTRDQTLHGIELLAERSGLSEVTVAQALLGLLRSDADGTHEASGNDHATAGYWLEGAGRTRLLQALGLAEQPALRAALAWREVARRAALPAYLGALLLGTLGLVMWLVREHAGADHGGLLASSLGTVGAVGAVGSWAWLSALLMLWPASEAVVAVMNRLISESARPQHLPRLALAAGIPPEHRVLVVVPAMLTSTAAVEHLVHRLHLHHLANPEAQAQFALLTDWADADSAQLPGDDALLAHAVQRVQALEASGAALAGSGSVCGGFVGCGEADRFRGPVPGVPRFLVLHRPRQWSETEQRWIGWERKRGKLEQLIDALAGPDQADGIRSSAFLDLGEVSRLAPGIRYVVTLDSDTQLPPGRLRELVGVAAHPQNAPRLDAAQRRVVGGYGILQPRVVTPLPAPRDFTLYHWLFAGQCGIDPYSAATSEVYQDLFGEGTFTGKGLLHVQALHAVLSGRLPEGRVLSHDLLEGSLARCAAVTDITLIEDAPFHADVAASRVHRWMRGDWQLLPFLLQPGRYAMARINRWKMFDNLRRSLVAPMSLALLLLMLALGDAAVSRWSVLLLVLAAFGAGPLMGAVAGFAPHRDDVAQRHFYRRAGLALAQVVWGALWHGAQLLQQALAALDAIARALWRLLVSHRHLLQWTTAAAAQSAATTDLAATLRRHIAEPALACLLLALLWAAGAPSPGWAVGLCLLWGAAPLWTWVVSRPRPPRIHALPAADVAYLEGLARQTWGLFERCVGADDHHLPPDNLQTAPQDMVAHRTSPTNIGLYLLAAACARQFGWIDTPALLARLEATLATLRTLQRHRGHFLNWYDTQSLVPLLPMYVSTVDSGNLSGHLLAVGQACRERARLPDEVGHVGRLHALAEAFETLAWEAEYGFLYHPKRHLFHIGYRVAEHQLDAGFYDLLASESRLTSLLAIAKGDVPVGHWGSLGRPFYAVGATAGLRSWSGSMFEYLMPTLVLDEPHGSVLRDACRAALVEQIAFAQAQAVPWGISECAYARRDHTLAYQYAPQGVPRLALRRTPQDELVIAPYATALAAQIAPHRACLNFAVLDALGARGAYGFIEALDFSPARRTGAEAFTPVCTFMSHHQGMSIVALANVLLEGVAQRWGMANAHIEAVASLLHERAPREVSMLYAPPAGPPPQALQRRLPGLLREVAPGEAAVEPTQMLSNGRYSVALRPNGAGSSRWGDQGLTRWRDDALRDAYGSFFYLRGGPVGGGIGVSPGAGDGAGTPAGDAPHDMALPLHSLTQHPAPDPAAHYGSTFHTDRVCFDAAWPGLRAHATVWVSPEDDIEFRQVELHNLGDSVLEIELISAFEVTLTDPRADESHPAFTNLFVRAAWQAEDEALLFERTPRLPTERGLHMAHFLTGNLAGSDPQVVGLRVQTDRLRWLGRNQGAARPLALLQPLATAEPGHPLPLDTGLDPVCVLAVKLRIAPQGKAQLIFATAASDNGDVLRAVVDKYRQPSHVQRASLMSATLAGIRLGGLRLGADHFAALQSLTTGLLFSLSRPISAAGPALGPVHGEACDRRLLWRFGLSGDRPILLVTAGVPQGLGMLRSLAQALQLWAWGAVACDLVVVNAEPASYLMALHREIGALRERHIANQAAEQQANHGVQTGFFLLRAEELSADELSTLHALARVRLHADGRPLLHHLQEWTEAHEHAYEQRHDGAVSAVPLAGGAALVVPAPHGEFAEGGSEFRFSVHIGRRPARPWINVLSNPAFGAQISEAGGGYTWAVNSRLNQLTAWTNDAVCDPPSEWFLLQDRRSQQIWSVTPSACGGLGEATYRVSHGQGWSTVGHRRGELEVTASWCVDPDTAVKQVRLRLVNRGHRTEHLRLVGIAEWMMGGARIDRHTVRTARYRERLATPPAATLAPQDVRQQRLVALLCTQRERSAGFGEGTAFLALAGDVGGGGDGGLGSETEDWTCDRRECFDARGRLVLPDHFGQASGTGLDPCAALATRVTLQAGEAVERVFLLGWGDNPAAAKALALRAAAIPALQRMDEARSRWDRLLGAATVRTPDPLFDALVNRWLLYQAVTCRLWAKAGFYQAGGATGFRDQLQDAMALTWAAPQVLREQILRCAARQFVEGDVQHWWHAPGGAGVRTHFSDDLLWLPHACSHYLRCTGDASLLDERVPFLEGSQIPDGAEDVYETPRIGTRLATVYEHAACALDRSLRVGVHGLPLMGSGDWNDGMNRVGIAGRGESVWLAWFLCDLVPRFAPLARARGDVARADRWEIAAEGWRAALEGPGWDGGWYRRAFFDDGQPLGANTNAEARIDLIAQSWAVLSHAARPERQRTALAAMDALLVDREAGLIRLLDPPLQHAVPSAGYIQAYPPGVRENGGQYTHAGVWALMAQAQAGDAERAWRYFTCLSPAHRAAHLTRGPAYGIEPYVVAGDVYSQPPYVGRGGWSWYTGAAAWLHRAAIESIFGLQQGAEHLSFQPCLPPHWPQAELTLVRDGRTMHFLLVRADDASALVAAATANLPTAAQVLRPGQLLRWTSLGAVSGFVVPLNAAGARISA